MNCQYCDTLIPPNALHCPGCGAQVQMQQPNQFQQPMAGQNPYMQQPNQFQQPMAGQNPYMPPPNRFQQPMPGQNPYMNQYPQYGQAKNKMVYLLLAIFLGSLGIHNFYAGYNGKGVAQLLITLISFGFLGWIVWIWAVIEGCTVEIDAKGIPMTR